jgi:serine/threonine protein phosphatase PrpC
MKGFEEAEKKFILENKPVNLINEFNRSGSCAIVVVILDDYCYIANLGDSRGLISENGGKKVFLLSKDHKPNDPDEKKRIYSAGGYIYQGINQNPNGSFNNININLNIKPIDSPWRIMPGKLSVTI